MLATERQAQIVGELRRTGVVRVSDLSALLGVSEMTVRRDLDVLATRGLLAKVHGGAVALEGATAVEPGFTVKSVRERDEKDAIAAHAVALLRPGMSVGVGAGTTTWALARHLTTIPDLTVVTNSLPVADVLHAMDAARLTVIITGGQRTPSDALVGPVAIHSLTKMHLDLVLLGAHGVDDRVGLTTPNLAEADTNRAFISGAARLVVLADHTKFGVIGLAEFAELSEISTLVTDDGADERILQSLEGQVGEIIVAASASTAEPASQVEAAR